MTTRSARLARFVEAGKIIAGDEPGWPARLARRLDMNRGYVASVVAGTRPINEDLERKLSAAIEEWFHQIKRDAGRAIQLRIEIDVELKESGSGDNN